MNPSAFMEEFESEFRVKVTPVTEDQKDWYGKVFSWKPTIEINGQYPTQIYELQKAALQEGLAMWTEGYTLLLDDEGFEELIGMVKHEWGVK